VKHGGKKGNVTLVSFDGKHKVVRQMQDTIIFDERLQAAKALIDECIQAGARAATPTSRCWSTTRSRSTSRARSAPAACWACAASKIQDEKWLQAMKAIADSMQVASTKPYIRFYERDDATGEYFPINLDVAAV
jgi:hypothetical protein